MNNQSLSRTKKAQVATLDFVLGLLIIIIAIVLTINIITTMQEPSTFNEVKTKGFTVAELLMSSGYPENWNSSTVIKTGLVSDNLFNITKLQEVELIPYNKLRATLNNPTHVYFYFTNKTTILNLSSCGYGDASVTVNDSCYPTFPQTNNLIRVDRFMNYNNTIIRMVVVVWD